MQKSNEDCFYFLTSTCAKGSACSYRHNPMVLTCNVVCPAWSSGNCIDQACPFRHSTVQRPTITNGKICFYENTPMGCLKLDCTFVHLRSRSNLRNSPTPRSSTTNLVNKEVIKPSPVINPPTNTINESVPIPQITPTPKIETPPVPEITLPTEPEPTNRNVVPEPSDDTKTPSRVVVSRNVVIAEPNRKVAQATTSNRVVVTAKRTTNDSDSDLDDLIEQENDTNRTNTVIDISFPCSAPSITNRLFTSTKPSTPTNDTKPIRLNRDRLPAPKISGPNTISTPTNGEKTSAGTGLSQDGERRTSRIERFKKKPVSPPRSVVNSTLIPTRNVINSSPNERKRPAPEQIINDSPPSKRLSLPQETNHITIGDLFSPPTSPHRTHTRHHRRRRSSPSPSPSPSSSSPSPPPLRKSPLRKAYSATSSMNDSTWKREVDEFLAKTTQPKPTVLPKPVPLLSLRPRYIPPLLQPSLPPPLMPGHQAPPVRIKRPIAPVAPSKPVEQVVSVSVPSPIDSKDEEENRLLELDGPTDVVDTFALIDEVLLETDDLFELT